MFVCSPHRSLVSRTGPPTARSSSFPLWYVLRLRLSVLVPAVSCRCLLRLVQSVFHPSAGYGNTYSTMGWAGLIGAITGYSSSQIAISEKGAVKRARLARSS